MVNLKATWADKAAAGCDMFTIAFPVILLILRDVPLAQDSKESCTDACISFFHTIHVTHPLYHEAGFFFSSFLIMMPLRRPTLLMAGPESLQGKDSCIRNAGKALFRVRRQSGGGEPGSNWEEKEGRRRRRRRRRGRREEG